MNKLKNQPFIQFDFDSKDQLPKIFTNPINIISTSKLENVSKCLTEAEKALKDGYFVAGYVSYEAIYALNQSLNKGHKLFSMPLVWFGVFDKPTSFSSYEKEDYDVGNWQLSVSEQSYKQTVENIIQKIHLQEIEQINYTVPFFANFSGDAYAYYEQLKRNQKASYSAFLQFDHYRILSISPELFFHLEDQTLTVKPMKGTIHRGKTYHHDMQLKQWLESSHKNKLENEMITRLMKEELSSIVKKESLEVIDRYKVEAYPTVYQMTSTIKGEVNDDFPVTDILKTLFPSGSITGIPKHKALDYIAHFEEENRDIYCGAIGYMTPNQHAIFNVPIRTVAIDQTKNLAKFGAGGAITKLSKPDEEYAEVVAKSNVLRLKFEPFQLLETFGLYNGEFIVFEEHIERLKKSASYFQFQIDLFKIREALNALTHTYKDGNWRVRLVVFEDGKYNLDVHALTSPKSYRVQLAKHPIDQDNIFFYHKTTNRKIYEVHLSGVENVFDVLLWNDNDEITEFTIGNVVVDIDGNLYTPPVACGLLAGTYREKLIAEGKITEKTIYKGELHKCSSIYLINSVRQWVPVELLRDQ